MKHRNPLAVVGLSIITLGIYDLYWLSTTRKELNSKTSRKVPTLWLLFTPVFVGIVLVIVLAANSSSSTASTGPNLIAVILMVLDFIAMMAISLIWFFKFSKAINEYTAGKLSTATTFLILWLLHLIGVALVQDTFNDMLTDQAPAAPQQPTPAMAQGQPMAQAPMQPNNFVPGGSPAAQPYNPAPPYSVQPEQQPTINQTFPPDTPVVG